MATRSCKVNPFLTRQNRPSPESYLVSEPQNSSLELAGPCERLLHRRRSGQRRCILAAFRVSHRYSRRCMSARRPPQRSRTRPVPVQSAYAPRCSARPFLPSAQPIATDSACSFSPLAGGDGVVSKALSTASPAAPSRSQRPRQPRAACISAERDQKASTYGLVSFLPRARAPEAPA